MSGTKIKSSSWLSALAKPRTRTSLWSNNMACIALRHNHFARRQTSPLTSSVEKIPLLSHGSVNSTRVFLKPRAPINAFTLQQTQVNAIHARPKQYFQFQHTSNATNTNTHTNTQQNAASNHISIINTSLVMPSKVNTLIQRTLQKTDKTFLNYISPTSDAQHFERVIKTTEQSTLKKNYLNATHQPTQQQQRTAPAVNLILKKQASFNETPSAPSNSGNENIARNLASQQALLGQALPQAPQIQASAIHSQPDISRLTEQVLKSIDQQIIAQKERLGKI